MEFLKIKSNALQIGLPMRFSMVHEGRKRQSDNESFQRCFFCSIFYFFEMVVFFFNDAALGSFRAGDSPAFREMQHLSIYCYLK